VLVSVKQGELRLRLEAPASSTQGNGVVAGDSLASMLDLSMAMAVLSPLPPGRTCATISLTVNMMAATQAGRILATASVERRASSVERRTPGPQRGVRTGRSVRPEGAALAGIGEFFTAPV